MNSLSRNSNIGEVQQTKKARTQGKETKNRLCDLCGEESKAVLYCRADEAKLCLNCDYQVHSSYQLFAKHTRYLLCDSCDSSPCSIFCSNHDLVLCQHCDWERHGSMSLLHDRRPLDGFIGCPSVTVFLATFGIEDLGQERNKNGEMDCGFDDCLIWDTPSMLDLDELIISDGSNHNFVATGVPALPKNRNAVCGQHKEEIICQLRQKARLEPNFDDNQFDNEPSSGFHSSVFKDNCLQNGAYSNFEHNTVATYFPSYAASAFKSCSLSTGEGAGTQADAMILPEFAPRVFCLERQNALARYKEKKKCRRYDRQIRYESRKIRAESRVRIRGRFAKIDH